MLCDDIEGGMGDEGKGGSKRRGYMYTYSRFKIKVKSLMSIQWR